MDGSGSCCHNTFSTFMGALTLKQINSLTSADPEAHHRWLEASRYTLRSLRSARHKDHSANLINILVMHLLLSAHLALLMDGADMSRETCGYWVFVRRQKKRHQLWRSSFSCWPDRSYGISAILKIMETRFFNMLLILDKLTFGHQDETFPLLKRGRGLRPDSSFSWCNFLPLGVATYHTLIKDSLYNLLAVSQHLVLRSGLMNFWSKHFEVHTLSHCCCNCWSGWNALWDI